MPPDPLAGVEAALCDHFAQQPVRAMVSFVGVQAIEVLRFEPVPGERAYVSLGMSRSPMTSVLDTVVDAEGPRAELLLHLHDEIDAHVDVWRQLAVLAAAPSVEGVVYAAGVTVDLGQPLAPDSRCTGGLIVTSPLAAVATATGPVEVLQVLPATAHELAWCRVRGSAALRERWANQGVDLLDLLRAAADLE